MSPLPLTAVELLKYVPDNPGYSLCDICREGVASWDNALFLRVLFSGDVSAFRKKQGRHVRCDESLSQYIVHPLFPPVNVSLAAQDKRRIDPVACARHELRVTQLWVEMQRAFGKRVSEVSQ